MKLTYKDIPLGKTMAKISGLDVLHDGGESCAYSDGDEGYIDGYVERPYIIFVALSNGYIYSVESRFIEAIPTKIEESTTKS